MYGDDWQTKTTTDVLGKNRIRVSNQEGEEVTFSFYEIPDGYKELVEKKEASE